MADMLSDLSLPSVPDQTDGQMRAVTDYLYLLHEQIQYSMENLDADNFNETGLQELGGILTSPLTARIEGDEGEIASLRLSADGLTSRMSDAEGSLSSLRQTVDGFTLEVINGASSSTLKLKSGSTVLDSEEIAFSGMVTFSDLSEAGMTTINGSNITTGMISAITMRACDFETMLATDGTVRGSIRMKYYREGTMDLLAGLIRLDDQGAGSTEEGKYRMILSTSRIFYDGNPVDFNIKIASAGGTSIQSTHGGIYLMSGTKLMETAAEDLYLRAGGNYYIYDPALGSYVTLRAYAGTAVFG